MNYEKEEHTLLGLELTTFCAVFKLSTNYARWAKNDQLTKVRYITTAKCDGCDAISGWHVRKSRIRSLSDLSEPMSGIIIRSLEIFGSVIREKIDKCHRVF